MTWRPDIRRTRRLASDRPVIAPELPYPFRSIFVVRGDSMTPTLRDGDLMLLAPAPGRRGNYDRGAVVAARIPTSSAPGAADAISVKRVVGLPGEYVRAGKDGSVWVEDELLCEPYLTTAARAAPGPGLSWLCGGDEYILMGDNRTDSWGSGQIGPVPASQIIGKAWLKLPTRRLLGRSTPGRPRQIH